MEKDFSSLQLKFFMSNPNVCFIINEQGDIIDSNIVAKRLFDCERSGKKYANVFHLIKDSDKIDSMRAFEHWRKTGVLDLVPLSLISGVGKVIDMSWSIYPGSNDNSFFSLFREISPDRRFSYLERLLSTTKIGAWEYEFESNTFSISKDAFSAIGQDRETSNVSLNELLNVFHEDDRERVRLEFDKSIQDHRNSFITKCRLSEFGHTASSWVFIKGLHRFRETGILYKSTGIIQKIDSEKALLDTYEKFYKVVNNAVVPIVICSTEGKITFANPAIETLYGYDIKELIGESPSIYNSGRNIYLNELGFSLTDYEKYFSNLWASIQNDSIGFWEGEVLNRTKNGKLLLVYLYIYAIRDEYGKIISYVGSNINISEHKKEEELLRLETFKAIANIAEKRDNETGQHMARIGEYCYLIASQLNMPNKYCRDIRLFSPMHDIGKVGIPDNILLAERKLTVDEFEIIKTHTTIGYDILKDKRSLTMAAEIALYHQEKYDGTGYPKGLTGKMIPLAARICTIADVYDALRSKRPYKKAFSEEESLKYISEGRGSHFDPELVDLFLEHSSEMDKIFRTMADN